MRPFMKGSSNQPYLIFQIDYQLLGALVLPIRYHRFGCHVFVSVSATYFRDVQIYTRAHKKPRNLGKLEVFRVIRYGYLLKKYVHAKG